MRYCLNFFTDVLLSSELEDSLSDLERSFEGLKLAAGGSLTDVIFGGFIILIIILGIFYALHKGLEEVFPSSDDKYCLNCNQYVEPKRGFSWIGFIFGFGILYLIYYAMKDAKCPICNSKNFGEKQEEKELEEEKWRCTDCKTEVKPNMKFCPECGKNFINMCKFCNKEILENAKFCSECGKSQI